MALTMMFAASMVSMLVLLLSIYLLEPRFSIIGRSLFTTQIVFGAALFAGILAVIGKPFEFLWVSYMRSMRYPARATHRHLCADPEAARIANDVFSRGDRGLSLEMALREYDERYASAGTGHERVSLLIEDGRGATLTGRTTKIPKRVEAIESFVRRSLARAAGGEEESLTLPPRFSGLTGEVMVMFFFSSFPFLASFGGANVTRLWTHPLRAGGWAQWPMGVMVGIMLGTLACVLVLILRDSGFLPPPALRGTCSPARTTVFSGWKWVSFDPARDLAIVRFYADDAADVLLLGAGGRQGVVRIGGRYLEHFISCWSLQERD